MKDFYASCASLERAKALDSIDAAVVTMILSVTRDIRYFRFFFYNLSNENWLDNKVFRQYISYNLSLSDRFRAYYVASYLRTVASKKPDQVTEVLEKSKPVNAYAIRYLLETVSSLPVGLTSKLVPLIAKKMSGSKLGEGELFAKIVLNLTSGQKYSAALSIVRELTRPQARKVSRQRGKAFGSLEKTEAVSRLEDYDLEQFLRAVLPPLTQKAGLRLARILQSNLVRCFEIEKKGRKKDFEDYSWIWRPSIAGGEGTVPRRGYQEYPH